jgi:hypothetical protein
VLGGQWLGTHSVVKKTRSSEICSRKFGGTLAEAVAACKGRLERGKKWVVIPGKGSVLKRKVSGEAPNRSAHGTCFKKPKDLPDCHWQ